jgi:hypothetical protein
VTSWWPDARFAVVVDLSVLPMLVPARFALVRGFGRLGAVALRSAGLAFVGAGMAAVAPVALARALLAQPRERGIDRASRRAFRAAIRGLRADLAAAAAQWPQGGAA